MKITQVSYGRKWGRPNYGSENFEMVAELESGDVPEAAILLIKAAVFRLADEPALAERFTDEAATIQMEYDQAHAPAPAGSAG